jgi:hypothetical protein
LACGLLLAGAALFTAAAGAATRAAAHPDAQQRAVSFYAHRIVKLRTETWYWQRVMGVPRSHLLSHSLGTHSVGRLQRLAVVWRRREHAAYRRAQHPPHYQAWLCIHAYEGSWADSGGPYYGGLQMSLSFQRAYGAWLLQSKGTADHWTPLEQIWTAERAHRASGFYPWSSTARFCGLL